MDELNHILEARRRTHGSFGDNARIGQSIRAVFRDQPGWASMPTHHREALDHIAGKLSRILSGQSSFADHWDDIAGYAQLAKKDYDDDIPF
jgi:hypothetical protein